jgi:hypothetical protein
MCSPVLDEVGIDRSHNRSAQRLILFRALCIEDLKADLEIRVINENGRILLVTFFQAVQEPALIGIRIFDIKTRIQALDKILGKTIVDPCAIVFAEDDPGFTSGIPNDVLPISSGAMKRVQCDDRLMGYSFVSFDEDLEQSYVAASSRAPSCLGRSCYDSLRGRSVSHLMVDQHRSQA